MYMSYVVFVPTRVPQVSVQRYMPWWLRLQRDALQAQQRFLTLDELTRQARRDFGNVELVDIELSIDLNEEQMYRHVVEESIRDVLPQRVERSLRRGDVTRATRPKQFKCTVCLQENGRVVRTRCGHYFHRACIEKAYMYDTRCPTCRREIVQRDEVETVTI